MVVTTTSWWFLIRDLMTNSNTVPRSATSQTFHNCKYASASGKFNCWCWISLVVVALACSCTGLAQAVAAPGTNPVAAYISEQTLITVTARVSANPSLIANSVHLARVDASGQVAVDLGLMFDDGTHGDLTSGDGIFTTQLTLNESAVTQVGLVASVAYKGQLLRIKSSPTFIAIVNRATVEQ